MPAETIGYDRCPLCGESIVADDSGKTRLSEHLPECPRRHDVVEAP